MFVLERQMNRYSEGEPDPMWIYNELNVPRFAIGSESNFFCQSLHY